MTGTGFTLHTHTNFAAELKPAPDGARRWAVRVLGQIRTYVEVPLTDTSAYEAALELQGLWSGKRPLLLQRG